MMMGLAAVLTYTSGQTLKAGKGGTLPAGTFKPGLGLQFHSVDAAGKAVFKVMAGRGNRDVAGPADPIQRNAGAYLPRIASGSWTVTNITRKPDMVFLKYTPAAANPATTPVPDTGILATAGTFLKENWMLLAAGAVAFKYLS